MYRRSTKYMTFNLFFWVFYFLFFTGFIYGSAPQSVLRNSSLIVPSVKKDAAKEESSTGIAPDAALHNINSTEGVWDSSKYISIDEVKPGMKAYCLTCYSGTEIEKFDFLFRVQMSVLSTQVLWPDAAARQYI
jgi:hypothetical protein